MQPLRGCARGDDEGVRGLGLLALLELAPVAERARGEVDLGHGLGDDLRAEPERLGAELVHELRPQDAGGEAGEVLDCNGEKGGALVTRDWGGSWELMGRG